VTGEAPGHALVGARDRVERVIAHGRVALGARRAGRNVIRGLGVAGLIAGKGRRGRVAGAALARGRMGLVVRGGARIPPGGRGADEHADVGRGLVTGRAGAHHRRYRGVAGDAERRTRDACRAELEAPRVHVAGAVAARAVAIQAPERDVIARVGDEGDVGEGRRHR